MTAQLIKSVQRVTIFSFSILAILLAACLVSLHQFLAGLGLGLFLGWLILMHLAWKVARFGQLALKSKRRPRMGTMTRLALAGLGAVLAVTYPEYFDYIGLAIGLVMPVAFVLFEFVYLHIVERLAGKG